MLFTDQNRKDIETLGYTVIPDVLTPEECATIRSKFWDWFDEIGSKLDRGNIKTWSPLNLPPNFHGGLIQSHCIGQAQFVWDVRTHPRVIQVFQELWKTNDLLVSFDAANASIYKERFKEPSLWPHYDQSPQTPGLLCVQGVMCLTDSPSKNHGGFTCWEKSHFVHQGFFKQKGIPTTSNDWYKFELDDLNEVLQDPMKFANDGITEPFEIKQVNVTASKGSLVLWRSDLIHQGRRPRINIKSEEDVRMATYVCMTPRRMASESALNKKKNAFIEGRGTNHWPHKVKLFAKYGRFPAKDLKCTPAGPYLKNDVEARLAGFEDRIELINMLRSASKRGQEYAKLTLEKYSL